MASRAELLIEANRRGLLTGAKKEKFDEAVRRGMITLPASEATDSQLQGAEVPQGKLTSEQQRRLQSSLVTPGAKTTLGAIGQGFKRGAESVGEGVAQRALDVGEFFGADTQQLRGRLGENRSIKQQEFKPTQEEFPVSSTIGEIGGTIAAFPVPTATIPRAIAAGGAFGATQFLEEGEGAGTFAANVGIDGILGGAGQWAAPYIQKGFSKGKALFSGLYKKATGADPRPSMFTDAGSLTNEGKRALDDLGMSKEEFGKIYTSLDQNLDPVQAARQARAEGQGITLSQGEVTQDFATQEAEATLRSGLGREAEAARAADILKQGQLAASQDSFIRGLGDISGGRDVAGGQVQGALREAKKLGRKEVSDLYDLAKNLPGDQSPIDSTALVDTIDDEVIGRGADPAVINSLESLMAKYGMIEGKIEKAGRFNNVVSSDGTRVKFKGEQTPINLDNAEDFRKGLNRLLPNDQSGTVSQVINKLDSIVDETIGGLTSGTAKNEAFQVARTAAREEFKKFSQKDIVDRLVSFKKGTSTDQIPPDVVMDRIYKGAEGLTNIRQIKKVLMGNPNNKTADAWRSIQAQSVADLFADSVNPATGDISGARLKSAIKRLGNGKMSVGEGKLKVILDDKFSEFNNLVKTVGDATIPLKGTTNPSGTAYKILNFMTRVGSVGQFGADAVLTVAGKAKDAANSRRILRGIETAAPEKVRQAIKANNELIDSFVALGVSRSAQTQ